MCPREKCLSHCTKGPKQEAYVQLSPTPAATGKMDSEDLALREPEHPHPAVPCTDPVVERRREFSTAFVHNEKPSVSRTS